MPISYHDVKYANTCEDQISAVPCVQHACEWKWGPRPADSGPFVPKTSRVLHHHRPDIKTPLPRFTIIVALVLVIAMVAFAIRAQSHYK